MPMTETEHNLAKDRLTRVAPGQPRRFAIAGKSGDKAMHMRVAQSAAQPMSQVEQPFKQGFQWRVVGVVHKLQGKYVFMEEASYGSVSEGKIIRAITQQLKNGGELWGGNDRKLSNLPGVFMPKAQADTYAETLETPLDKVGNDESYDESATPEPAAVAVPDPKDPFDTYHKAFGDVQGDLFDAADAFEAAILRLEGVLKGSGDDFLKDEVAAKHLPKYKKSTQVQGLLQDTAKVLLSGPEGRVDALKRVVTSVKTLTDFMDKWKTELDAMQSHQPPEGAPVPASELKTKAGEMTAVCNYIISEAAKWTRSSSSPSSGTSTTSTSTS